MTILRQKVIDGATLKIISQTIISHFYRLSSGKTQQKKDGLLSHIREVAKTAEG